MKKWLIGGGVVVLLVVIYAALQIFYWSPNWQTIVNRCVNYDSQWEGMVDCYGTISIWSNWDEPYYSVANNDAACCSIAEIKSENDFIVQGDEIYLIDITPKGGCANNEPGYCLDTQVNGQPKTLHYDNPNQVPTYLMVNTKTGDEQFYLQAQAASSSDAAIFRELITKENSEPWYDRLLNSHSNKAYSTGSTSET